MNELFRRRWAPSEVRSGASRGVYLLHGYGEHSGRYSRLAEHLANNGWHVGAHDHPGHGKSPGERGGLTHDEAFAECALAEYRVFAGEIGSDPVLLGHSLGGTLALELVLQHQQNPPALVMSSPALQPAMTRWQRLQLATMHLLAPDKIISKASDPAALTSDPIEVQAHRDDPLTHSRVSARFIRWLITSGETSMALAHTLNTPTLLLVAAADRVVDPAASLEFARRVNSSGAECLTVKMYESFHHEIFNETPARRQQVFNDLVAWLADTCDQA